jgi:hypothetical protein
VRRAQLEAAEYLVRQTWLDHHCADALGPAGKLRRDPQRGRDDVDDHACAWGKRAGSKRATNALDLVSELPAEIRSAPYRSTGWPAPLSKRLRMSSSTIGVPG